MLAYQPLATFCHQVDLPDKNYVMLHCKGMHLKEHSMYLMFQYIPQICLFLLMKLEPITEIYYVRKNGYSVRGKPPQNHSLLVRGERLSAIACISAKGILDVKVVKGTSNGDIFYNFIHSHLLAHLLPFDGRNLHSVLVLDNCSIHHISEVRQVLEEVGVLVHYLPPYSPGYNPIEEAFSKVKQSLRSESDETHDVETQLYSSFLCVSPEDCVQWIKHSEIYN